MPKVIKCVGDVVKSIDDETYGGYGVRFTSPLHPDLTDEFFDGSTYFWPDVPTTVVLYDHTFGVHPKGIEIDKENKQIEVRQLEPYKYRIGHVVKRVQDERGIYIEFKLDPTIAVYNEQLNMWEDLVDEEHQQWLDRIRKRLRKGELNFSSDSMEHLVEREYLQDYGVYHIKSWPLPLISITPKAAEPETLINQVKAVSDEVLSSTSVPQARLTRVAQDAPQPNELTQEKNTMELLTEAERLSATRLAVNQQWDSLKGFDFGKEIQAIKAEGDVPEEETPEEETTMKGDFAAQLQPIAQSLAALYGGTTEEWLAAVMQVGAALQMETVAPAEQPMAEGDMLTEEVVSIDRKAVRKALNMGGYRTKGVGFNRGVKTAGWGEMIIAIKNRNVRALKAMGIDPDSAGGYLVPQAQSDQVIELLLAKSIFMNGGEAESLATYLELPSGNESIPAFNTGITAQWIAENAEIGTSQPTFRQIKLVTKKLAVIVPISNKLLRSAATNVDQQIRALIARSFANAVDKAVLVGSGQGEEPMGIANHTNVTITDKSGVPAYTDLVALMSRLEQSNVEMDDSVAWIISYRDKNQLSLLKDDANHYIFRGTGLLGDQLAGAIPPTLLGRRFILTNNVAAGEGSLRAGFTNAANETNIYLGRMRDIYIGMQRSLEIVASDQAGTSFQYDQTWIRALIDVDVNLAHPESIQILSGVQAS